MRRCVVALVLGIASAAAAEPRITERLEGDGWMGAAFHDPGGFRFCTVGTSHEGGLDLSWTLEGDGRLTLFLSEPSWRASKVAAHPLAVIVDGRRLGADRARVVDRDLLALPLGDGDLIGTLAGAETLRLESVAGAIAVRVADIRPALEGLGRCVERHGGAAVARGAEGD